MDILSKLPRLAVPWKVLGLVLENVNKTEDCSMLSKLLTLAAADLHMNRFKRDRSHQTLPGPNAVINYFILEVNLPPNLSLSD